MVDREMTVGELSMSALGQKQTCAAHKPMSALPPIADMCGAKRDVRVVPITDTDANTDGPSRSAVASVARNVATRLRLMLVAFPGLKARIWASNSKGIFGNQEEPCRS